MLDGTITPGMKDEITFLTGVEENGQIANRSFWRWNYDIPASYHDTAKAGKWGTPTAGTGAEITYYFDPSGNFTAAEKQLFTSVFAMWSAVSNIRFTQVSYASSAQLSIKTWNVSGAYQGVSTGSNTLGRVGSRTLNQFTSGTINVDSGNHPNSALNPGQFWYILEHEVGHVLGLGHSGPYDGNSVNTMTQQFGPYDTLEWTAMSYIPPGCIGAYDDYYELSGTNWRGGYSTTPMPLDILAIQRLYGKPTSTPLSGGQVFGFNCNIAGPIAPVYDFTKNTRPVVTLWDLGVGNTLDLSGYSDPETVSLAPGTFSSVAGLTNNLAIAFETAIDTLVCGSGNTTVICNNNGDRVIGGRGNDVFTGGGGNDILDGGAGTDTAVYAGTRSAYVVTHNANGSTTITGADGTDTLSHIERALFADRMVAIGSTTKNDFTGTGCSAILWQNDDGTAAVWTFDGFTQTGGSPVGGNPGPTWHVAGSGDFFSDGKADILWQNDDGSTVMWTMDGLNQTGNAWVGANPGASWHVKGVADFNADGKDDILWQNDNGQAAVWQMNGFDVIAGSYVGGNPGTDWHIVGTGDFNKDGKADIVWQNTSGQAAIWTMDGFNQTGSYFVGGNPGTAWHLKGTGDFYGTGQSDLLWQNDAGQAVIWTMDGVTQVRSDFVGGNPGADWHIVSTGDFNADGCSDILWQNDNGQAAIWTMSGITQLAGSLVGGNPGTTWHIPAGVG